MTTPAPSPLSRRSFLKQAAGSALLLSGIGGAQSAQAQEAAPTARAKNLLASCFAVDMHSHIGGSSFRRQVNDFPALQASTLAAVCMSLVADSPVIRYMDGHIQAFRQPEPGELYTNMLARLDFAEQAISSNKLRRITTHAELKSAKADGVPGVILTTEGSDFLEGKLERLQTVYARGVRHLQLVHYRADSGVADIQTEPASYHGTTRFGLDLARAGNELGMVLDVAHATFEAVKQYAAISTTPLILSHTAYNASPKPYGRTINAEHAKLVAATGGVIGVWANGAMFRTYADFADGVAKLADVVGAAHVGIGSDLNGVVHPMPFSYPSFPDLVDQLFRHFNEEELHQILGGNYLRVFDQVTAQRPA